MRAAIIIFITLCLISGQMLCFRVFGCTGGSLMFKCMISNQEETDKQHKEPHCGTSVIQDEYIGQTITVRCEYDHKFKTHTKVFYRLNGEPVHVMNSSRSSGSSEEKFILSDSDKDDFTVTIRDISAADGGVERDESSHTITHMTFFKEIHLNVYGQMTSVQVQAYSSKSVFITCTFPQEFKGNEKFIQKDSSQKILVNRQNPWEYRGNMHMFDDSSEGLLKVFLTDLTAYDEGTYSCGVNINDDDLFTEVKLTVNPGKVRSEEPPGHLTYERGSDGLCLDPV